MSETLNECDAHPSEDRSFRSSVLKTLIARHMLGLLPRNQTPRTTAPPAEFISALGVDMVWSELINDCADRIDNGTCSKYAVRANGLSVLVEPRLQQ